MVHYLVIVGFVFLGSLSAAAGEKWVCITGLKD
jgi:hypothetical protein